VSREPNNKYYGFRNENGQEVQKCKIIPASKHIPLDISKHKKLKLLVFIQAKTILVLIYAQTCPVTLKIKKRNLGEIIQNPLHWFSLCCASDNPQIFMLDIGFSHMKKMREKNV